MINHLMAVMDEMFRLMTSKRFKSVFESMFSISVSITEVQKFSDFVEVSSSVSDGTKITCEKIKQWF